MFIQITNPLGNPVVFSMIFWGLFVLFAMSVVDMKRDWLFSWFAVSLFAGLAGYFIVGLEPDVHGAKFVRIVQLHYFASAGFFLVVPWLFRYVIKRKSGTGWEVVLKKVVNYTPHVAVVFLLALCICIVVSVLDKSEGGILLKVVGSAVALSLVFFFVVWFFHRLEEMIGF